MSIPTTFNRMGLALMPTPPPTPVGLDYINFTATENGSAVRFEKATYGEPNPDAQPDYECSIEYSFDKSHWTTWEIFEPIELNAGDKIWVRGDNPSGFGNHDDRNYHFAMSGSINANGNMMSLLDSTCEQKLLPANAFQHLFRNAYSLKSAPYLPADVHGDSDGGFKESAMAWCFADTNISSYVHYPSGNLGMFGDAYGYLLYNTYQLNRIEFHGTTWDPEYTWWNVSMFNGWLEYTSDHGDFIIPSSLQIIKDVSHIPWNWTAYTFEGVAVGGNNDYITFYSDYYGNYDALFYAIPSGDTISSVTFDHALPSSFSIVSGANANCPNAFELYYNGTRTPVYDTWQITFTTDKGESNTAEAKINVVESQLFIDTDTLIFAVGASGTFTPEFHSDPEFIKDSGGFTPVMTIISGTLPSGVAFSNNVFTYDGHDTSDVSGTIGLRLESSSGNSVPTEREMTIILKNFAVNPIIATGLNMFTPCSGNYDNILGTDMTAVSGAPSATINDNIDCIYFDGSTILQGSGYFTPFIDDDGNYHDEGRTTVCFWYKAPSSLTKEMSVMQVGGKEYNYGGSCDQMKVYYDSDISEWCMGLIQPGHWLHRLGVVSDGDWHFYAMRIWNNWGRLDGFMDNNHDDGEDRSWYYIPSPSVVTIGAEYNTNSDNPGFRPEDNDYKLLEGWMSCIKVYNRILSDDEIALLAANPPEHIEPVNPVEPFYFESKQDSNSVQLNYVGYVDSVDNGHMEQGEGWDEPQESIYHPAETHWDDELQEEVIDVEEWWEDQEPIHHEGEEYWVSEYEPIQPYNIEYSTDKVTWQSAEFTPTNFDPVNGGGSDGSYSFPVTLNTGDRIYIRGNNTAFYIDASAYGYFLAPNTEVGGNIMSLLDPTMQQTEAPENCFRNLFCSTDGYYNAGILDAKNLSMPATEIGESCYREMFMNNTTLSSAPSCLPATALSGNNCYQSMFAGCTALGASPILSATTLTSGCYEEMFNGCTNLSAVTTCMTGWFASDGSDGRETSAWLSGVAPTGIFICNMNALNTSSIDESHVPSGWNVYNNNIEALRFTPANENSTVRMGLYKHGTPSNAINVITSFDGVNWSPYTVHTEMTIPASGTLYMRGSNDAINVSNSNLNNYFFYSYNPVNCDGDIMALLKPMNTLPDYCFYRLFDNSTTLKTAPEINVTTIGNSSCKYMFIGCTALTKAPSFSTVQTIRNNGCESMFEGCTSLTDVPQQLPNSLNESACDCMFKGCASITVAPTLPCYSLFRRVYGGMFNGCSSLSSITMTARSWSYGSHTGIAEPTNNWVAGVAASGVFTCRAELSEEYGDSRIPTGWTVVTV